MNRISEGWYEYRKLVLSELQRLTNEIKELRKALDEIKDLIDEKNQECLDDIQEVKDRLGPLEVKSGLKTAFISAAIALFSGLAYVIYAWIAKS